MKTYYQLESLSHLQRSNKENKYNLLFAHIDNFFMKDQGVIMYGIVMYKPQYICAVPVVGN